MKAWFQVGTVLRVTANLDAGSMSVSSSHAAHTGADAPDGAVWLAYESGLKPGAVVGVGLFPVVSGTDGARIQLLSASGRAEVHAAADTVFGGASGK